MPFTFSHPAIILPLRYLPKNWFSFTGLVIGSLTPDFEYFIRMKVQSNYSHTILGIFWFDLPLAILLTFLFHNLVRDSLFSNLPKSFQSRTLIFTELDWNLYFKKNWIVVLISILIGIASHLFWDGFTHNHGYFVNQFSELKNVLLLFGNEVPIWKITQHMSTLIGGVFIVLSYLKLPTKPIIKSSISKKYWITIFVLTAFILFIRFSISFNAKAFGNIIVSMIAAFLVSLILSPLIIKSKVISKM
ncbi:DUF4184 family protein [Flavobacterium sp. FlaQc-57]|uniref:DUF4184 family protein n=1 Tax=Flavobacterium sp. FlaQc-57 TaxID=3374186 RepID=UPI0037583F89